MIATFEAKESIAAKHALKLTMLMFGTFSPAAGVTVDQSAGAIVAGYTSLYRGILKALNESR